MESQDALEKVLAATRTSRRAMLGSILGSGALLTAGLATASTAAGLSNNFRADPPFNTKKMPERDVRILNFALQLEYLEAEFYLMTTGISPSGLSPSDTTGKGQLGETTGGVITNFSAPLLQQTVNEITSDEVAHVKLIRSVLGKKAVAKPAINLNPLGLDLSTQGVFLTYSRAFEDTGVSAYGGAVPLIQNTDILAAAARIALMEAYHAGNIRLQVVEAGLSVPALDAKDGPPTDTNFFPAFPDTPNNSGLPPVRTPAEVAAIVGPFFPNGLNSRLP